MSVKYHQKCYQSPSKEPRLLPTSTATAAIQGYEKGCFFTYRGEDTGYFYTATGDRLSVFESNGYIEDATLSFTIAFGSTANVIDCIYFPLNETSPGLVVAVYDSALTQQRHKFYLAYVSLTKKRVLKKVAAPGQVNSLANIVDGAQYPSQVHGLNSAFQKNWPHIIGVSIYESGAALTHLAMTSEEEEHGEHCHKATNVIIFGKTFITDADSFKFQDDQGRSYSGNRSNFYVSKFAYVERCAIVIMGFPFGGIYMVSLRTQRPYAFFMAEGVIEDCAIQDADDDPRGFFYIWFALSRGDKAHALSAYAIFPEEDEKKKCYDNPQFVFSINFTLSDFMSFLSLKTMHVDRSRLAGSPKDNDTSLNESVVSNNKSSSLALFTWLSSTKPTRVYGALFDLNMYYFKRTPTRLNPDDTELRQIPFCSGFQTDDSVDIKNMEIFDIVMIPNSLRAFVSVDNEDKDQLFYPSVYSFSLKSLTRKTALYLTVDSIQDQFLKEVSTNFVENWSNPSNACMKFHALGIGALPYESNDKRFYQLSTFLKHSYHFCIIDFILNDETPVTDLKFLLKWLNKEVEVNKETLDRFCQPLLDGGEISHTAMQFIIFSEYLFYRICQIIDALIERVQKLEQEDSFLKILKVASTVANGINLYSIGIKFGLANKMLPQSFGPLNKDLKKIFNDQMLNNNRASLSIIKLIQECMDSASDSSIWENKTPQEWYPPQSYSTWLGIFLMVNLSKTAKATLFGYYLYDLIRKGLCQDDKLLDKGLGYFLFNDKDKLLAIKRRIEKMHKSDEMVSNAKSTDVGLEQVVKDMKNPQNENPKTLDDFYNLPLMNQNQIDTAKGYFSKLDFGVHYWNKSVLDKRRYELIEIPEPPTGPEPAEVKEIREKVNQLQRSKPWLFQKNQLISVVKEWIDESTAIKESPVSRRIEMRDISVSRKRTIDEVIAAEEDAFPLATPIKQGRKSIFADTPAAKAFKAFENDKQSPTENDNTMSPVVNKDIDNKSMTDKQWERIKQITKTPPATPLVSRLQISPEPSALKRPTSILKSNKKQSRITPSTKRVKLQFDDNLSTVKSIPNRHEQRTPIPDAFTMEDSSMTSEMEQQPMEDDENIIEEDVLGPVKLNFDDIDDDEHPKIQTIEDDNMSDGDNENIPVLPEKQSEENGENVLNTSFENEDENVGEDSLIRSFEKQESDDEDNLIRSFEKQESDDEDDLIRSFETQNEEDEQVKPMESIPEVTEPFPSPPKRLSSPPKRSLYKTPSPETSMEAPDHGIRKSPRLRSANVEEQSQPAKSVVSISKVTETVPASPLKRAIRKTPSRESSMEAPEVGNRKSPRSRKTSVSIEERPQAAKLMEPIPEVTEHFQASPRKRSVRKTPSRESSIDAPEVGRRKSPRSKKSSVNVEDKLQPAKLMEPIPEVTEHFPASPRKRPVRKTSSRESSMEAPDISSRKSPRSRKSSVNVEDKLQPAKSMEPIPEVTEHFPASPRKRPVRKTPSRESSMDAPEVGRRKSPRKSSISVEQAKPMEPITEVSEVLSSFTEEWRQKNRRPPLTKRVIRKTPSRESSMEAPDLRKSPRLRKSSSNVEERSQPVASMESIAEVSETPNRTRGRPKKH